MVNWFNSWSKGIVAAVIISTILEMILPNNNSKKYIKILLGIFVVYTIISPIIVTFTGKKIDDYVNFKEYEETVGERADGSSKEITNNSIKRIYTANLENDLTVKINNLGYIPSKVMVKISDDNLYSIEQINLSIQEKKAEVKAEKQVRSIVESIKTIVVSIDNSGQDEKIINEADIDKIKKMVKEQYGVSEEKIQID